MDVARHRLASQHVTAPASDPAAAVARLLAVQGQDWPGTVWALALRARATAAEVEAAFERGELVRTWPMRGTLHVVATADVRWLVGLLAGRVLGTTGKRRAALGLDDDTLLRCRRHLERALAGTVLGRTEVFASLEAAGIPMDPHRGYHVLFHLSSLGVLVQVGRDRYALLDERVPAAPALDPDEALARLARRYLAGHAPATAADLAWWAGLSVGEARRALAAAGPVAPPANPPPAGVHLLPGFDELLLGYKDRTAVLDPAFADRVCPGGNGVFRPTVLVDGRMVGTWKAKVAAKHVAISLDGFAGPIDPEVVRPAAERYAAFVGRPLRL